MASLLSVLARYVRVNAPLVLMQSDAAPKLQPSSVCARSTSVAVFIRLRAGLLPLLPRTGKCLHVLPSNL